MLQTLLQMLFLAAVHVNASSEALLEALHLFSGMPLCGHMVTILILVNRYGITNSFYGKTL